MKRTSVFLLVFCLPFLFFPRLSFSGMIPYEAGKLTTIEGKVTDIYTVDNRTTSELGFHLRLATSSGDYIVHVSPQWYADQQRFQFMAGEALTVTGSAFTRDNQKNIYAATIVRRFSSLSNEQQVKVASEILSSPSADLQAIATKYAVPLDEAERIKARVEQYVNTALFPEPLQLRDQKTGDGLWGGRFYEQNMPLIRQQRQQDIRDRMMMMKQRKR